MTLQHHPLSAAHFLGRCCESPYHTHVGSKSDVVLAVALGRLAESLQLGSLAASTVARDKEGKQQCETGGSSHEAARDCRINAFLHSVNT